MAVITLRIWIPQPVWALERISIPLIEFDAPGLVKLNTNVSGLTLHVPAPRRWQIETATLDLSWVNSTALLSSRSRLVVLFNDYPLAQITLEPEAPVGEATLEIPARLFDVGYNELRFEVAQNIKDEGCIPQDPPEAWTTLRLIDSTLTLGYSLREVPLSLASVPDFLFDPRIGGPQRVHIVTETTDDQDLRRAVIAAAAVALRFDYRPVRFTTGQRLVPGMDNVVIGEHRFLRALLPESKIDGDMGLLPMITEDGSLDRQHGLVVLGGRTPDEVERSVRAFSILSLPLPDMQFCRIRDVQLPEITPYSWRNRRKPGKTYTLAELGLPTTTFRGFNPAPSRLSFTLPTNLYLEENRVLTLSLDLSYSAAMRADSVLVMEINRKFVASVPLDQPKGGQFRGYRIQIPLSYLIPGRNELGFRPVLVPLHGRDCELFQDRNLALTIFATSTLKVPRLAQWVRMPQLAYLFNDGFPLTARPDFTGTGLILPRRNRMAMAAALNLIAEISQKTGVLPYGLTIGDRLAGDRRNYLVVGTRSALPGTILDSSPLSRGISMPVHGRLPGTLRVSTWKEKFIGWLFDEDMNQKPVTPDIGLLGTDLKIRPSQAVLCEFESPLAPMHSVVLLTAERESDLYRASLVLQDQEVRYQCRNGFVLLDFSGRKPSVQVAALTPRYSVGELTLINRISWLVDRYRWWLAGGLGGLILVLALLLHLALNRLRRKRLGLDNREDES